MSHDKKGISAVQLMKEIGVSYLTAWPMQHKIRKAMEDRDGRYKLHGIIEVDEGYVGGVESRRRPQGTRRQEQMRGGRGRRARAEGQPGRPPVPGFAALQVLPDAGVQEHRRLPRGQGRARQPDPLRRLERLLAMLDEKGFEHTATALSSQDEPAHKLFPWVHIPCPT